MSVTVHTPHFVWARAHRAALVIVLLALALAATAGLLIAQLASNAAPAPVSTVHGPTFVPVPTVSQDNCPQQGRRGQTPC
ncbi:MAG TPA: hypothetical protein VGN28_03515 [Blastococcus sp.]|jgi:hypothetical protein|nr:hypothetical protein [Blastococcus sp.]